MATIKPYPFLLGFLALFLFARPALAFGAGNIAGISAVEGQNWRHGDIEDALLQILMARAVGGKKFDKLMVSRVYFGNWLRDYSQAIDVGTVKSVSAEAIRLLLCVLGFLTFGYGSREFEVTADRLGCYRPEDHIDNPKNYADNEDARNYDRRLRGPVDERVELAVDPETGMKNYIANERANIMTSALHVRRLFTKCVELGRNYSRSNNKKDLYEALRLLGTGLHCLEDFFAHSNYTELALIEMGERDVFPHVGRNTQIRIPGARGSVYPLVTGTFGGVDFLHSVTGEVSDKLTQSELQDLEGTLQESQNKDTSYLRELLDKIPDGLLGSGNGKAKMDDIQHNAQAAAQQTEPVSPRDPEEFTIYIQQIFAQVMPAIEFHDELLQTISEAIEKIPVLPKIIEQLEEQLSAFVFSIIAPFIIPVLDQVKNELATGATEIIESSKNEQLIVFHDDHSTDPTHSMLSKDHFSNILNEIAGKTASKMISWVVPQLMELWDDPNRDINDTLNTIIYGVLHHPAQRNEGSGGARQGRALIFQSIEEWWSNMNEDAKQEYRQKLSRRGVENGQNHKEGVHDTGHGCGGKLQMHKNYGPQTMEDKIAGAAVDAIMGGVKQGFSNVSQGVSQQSGGSSSGLGGFLGGLLGGSFSKENTDTFRSSGRTEDGGYQQTTTQYGREGERYGQAEYSETQYGDGSRRSEYNRYEQDESRGGEYDRQERVETRYGGEAESYSREEYREERREESYGGGYGGGYGRREETREESYGGGYGGSREESYGERREESYGGGYGSREESYGGERREDEEREEESGGNVFSDFANQARRALEDDEGEDQGERRGWGF
ncbi:ATP-dependent RNA helicase DDX42 [Echria macrotheca]|uniref:ATP-dependent RNA helicase DDX42 n=1 Tax=Echria macrotheca TaxID=438768 RepID=A0AAJ0BK80_9PEZI|nr:ATP-dependent RNA helicase DDX42 [Echria macrotheca]